MAELVRQVKDLSDHLLALSWRLDLQEQTLIQRLHEVRLQCCLGESQPRRVGSWCSSGPLRVEA